MGMLLYVPKRAQGSRMSYDLLQSKLPEVIKRSIVCISIIVNIFHLKEEFLYLQAYTSENLQCIGQQFENTQLLCLAFLTGLHIVVVTHQRLWNVGETRFTDIFKALVILSLYTSLSVFLSMQEDCGFVAGLHEAETFHKALKCIQQII